MLPGLGISTFRAGNGGQPPSFRSLASSPTSRATPYSSCPAAGPSRIYGTNRAGQQGDHLGQDTLDPAALAKLTRAHHCAALIAISLRTLTRHRRSCAICSYLSTAAKHGRSFFGALVTLTAGQP